MLCDARSTPARLAVVLLHDKRVWYSDLAPPERLLETLRTRGDGQIMSLEILAIAFGMSTMQHLIAGQSVRVYSDNVGAERAVTNGKARAFDHSCLIHTLWLMASELGMSLHVSRVPTKENVADLPSREQYMLLNELSAQFVEPRIDQRFFEAQAWESLRVIGRL